jgi:riboflavin kinase/FMN adenylyltransferase
MAYIGNRPTLTNGPPGAPQLEVHVLDFTGDLYGRRLEVALLERMRGEQRLPSLPALERRIAENLARVRRYFEERGRP